MEFGPRALGNRSILADPRIANMQETLNLKIKFRESFRPFAPAVLRERVADYFELEEASPYMLLVAAGEVRPASTEPENATPRLIFIERLKAPRSTIPAVTHVDYSARVQTVSAEDNPRFHQLLSEFERQTGCAVLVNTSFNVRGEPPVCTPEDAYRCFMRTGMDYLVLGNFLVAKTAQPKPATSPDTMRSSPLAWINAEYRKARALSGARCASLGSRSRRLLVYRPFPRLPWTRRRRGSGARSALGFLLAAGVAPGGSGLFTGSGSVSRSCSARS